MIEYLFLDLDDTILDFKAQEDAAIVKTLTGAGITPTEEICARYSQINKEHWARMEKGEIDRQQVLFGRFQVLFKELGVDADWEIAARAYMENLSQGHYFLPGAEETLKKLHKKYRLYLASNGTASVQAGRLKSANISHYFEEIFISQEMGANKPSLDYFARCFARIPGFDAGKAMMVGDSLASDITGGKNAGMLTCWVNPKGRTAAQVIPDYEIQSITQLPELLESL